MINSFNLEKFIPRKLTEAKKVMFCSFTKQMAVKEKFVGYKNILIYKMQKRKADLMTLPISMPYHPILAN